MREVGFAGRSFRPWRHSQPRAAPRSQDEGDGDRTQRAVAKTQALNVTVVAYGPLGQTTGQSVKSVISNPTVASIGEAQGKSGAQVALRYLVQARPNVLHSPPTSR